MKVGILLLSQDGFYADNYGRLPRRPKFDKTLLLALCKGSKAICGLNTRDTLPESITSVLHSIEPWDSEYDINLGIQSLYKAPPQLLIVVRSEQWLHKGKRFDLSKFIPLYHNKEIELYTYLWYMEF